LIIVLNSLLNNNTFADVATLSILPVAQFVKHFILKGELSYKLYKPASLMQLSYEERISPYRWLLVIIRSNMTTKSHNFMSFN